MLGFSHRDMTAFTPGKPFSAHAAWLKKDKEP
jgi:hypothetical protein